MPHITIEYSNNLSQKLTESKLMRTLHDCVIAHDVAAVKIKTRMIKVDDYIVGEGQPENSMMHVSLLLLEGRGEAFAEKLGADFHGVLQSTLADQGITDCAATLEVREMNSNLYFK